MIVVNSYRYAKAVADFTMTWRTTAASETITLPWTNPGQDVDWGDGTINQLNSHTYAAAGDYDVKISGTVTGFAFNNTGDRTKIRAIKSWQGFEFSTVGSFYGCTNLDCVGALGTPTFSSSDSALRNTFRDCSNLTEIGGNIPDWILPTGANLEAFLFNAISYNNAELIDLPTANVISVANMLRSTPFDQNIGSWIIASLTNAFAMFFNGSLSTSNLDALYNGWAAQAPSINSSVPFSAGTTQYTIATSGASRAILTGAPYNWTITDGGGI